MKNFLKNLFSRKQMTIKQVLKEAENLDKTTVDLFKANQKIINEHYKNLK